MNSNTLRNNVLLFILKDVMNTRIQDAVHQAVPALLEHYSLEQKLSGKIPDEFLIARIKRMEQAFSPGNLQVLWREVLLCRNADTLDYYLAQMLRKVFIERPEVLRASEFSIQMSEVLQCSSIEEVVLRFTEKKVQDLGYKGLLDVIKYVNRNFGLDFDISMPEFIEVCEMYQVRNIIVHNACIINETFLKNTDRSDLQVGERYPLTDAYVSEISAKLVGVGRQLDNQFCSHFKLH